MKRNKLSLTNKKEKWAKARPKTTLEGKRLNYNAAVQAMYVESLHKLIERMTAYTKKRLVALFESRTAKEFEIKLAMDADIASEARILTNELTRKFQRLFNLNAKDLAEKMVQRTDKVSAASLGVSLKQLSGGLTINSKTMPAALKTIIKASVTENVALIKSIPADYLARVQKQVMRSLTTGNGLDTLIPALNKYEGITKRHAKNMALDQTRKVYNSMNAQRMQKVGLKTFRWIHSGGGQRPRKSHIAMNGKIYSFDNLPIINKEQVDKGYEAAEHGIPGQAVNCKCIMQPVTDYSEMKGA